MLFLNRDSLIKKIIMFIVILPITRAIAMSPSLLIKVTKDMAKTNNNEIHASMKKNITKKKSIMYTQADSKHNALD